MAKTQTRRSVSVRGLTYQRVRNHVSGGSISGFVEEVIQQRLGEPDDEDHRKFGEAMKAREKKSEAPKTKAPEATVPEAEEPSEFDKIYTSPLKLF